MMIKNKTIGLAGWLIIGVFALFADLAGKISLIQLESLILYFLLFIVGSVILTFWVLPAVISALTDFPIKHVLKEMKGGLAS